MNQFNVWFKVLVTLSLYVVIYYTSQLYDQAYLVFTQYRNTLNEIADSKCYDTYDFDMKVKLESIDKRVLHHYSMVGSFFYGLIYLTGVATILLLISLIKKRSK
jgi:hypothetical protein